MVCLTIMCLSAGLASTHSHFDNGSFKNVKIKCDFLKLTELNPLS